MGCFHAYAQGVFVLGAAILRSISVICLRGSPLRHDREIRGLLKKSLTNCRSVYITCGLYKLRSEGKIPILGGIRVVRESWNEALQT